MRRFFNTDYLEERPCTYVSDRECKLALLFNAKGFPGVKTPIVERNIRFQLMREKGFMSMQGTPFVPNCDDCQKCVPIRINSEKVSLEPKSSKYKLFMKGLNKFKFHLVETGQAYPDHYRLYEDYMARRHPGSEMSGYSLEEFNTWVNSRSHIYELFDKEDNDRLIGFALIDTHENMASFDYLVYDVSLSRKLSLGTFSWMALTHTCAQNGYSEMYCGHWVKGSSKMGYKSNFPGQETLVDDEWVDLNPEIHSEGPDYQAILDKLHNDGLEIT